MALASRNAMGAYLALAARQAVAHAEEATALLDVIDRGQDISAEELRLILGRL